MTSVAAVPGLATELRDILFARSREGPVTPFKGKETNIMCATVANDIADITKRNFRHEGTFLRADMDWPVLIVCPCELKARSEADMQRAAQLLEHFIGPAPAPAHRMLPEKKNVSC